MKLMIYRNMCAVVVLAVAITVVTGHHAVAAHLADAAAPDAYEPDDTFSQARVIVVNNSSPQSHNFHKAGDQDWVKFYGIAGQTYSIRAANLGTRCDIVLELYDSDGKTLLKSRDDGRAGQDETLEWACTKDAFLYLKTRNYNADIFGDDTNYDLRLYQPVGPPLGLITGIISDKNSAALIDAAIITTNAGGSAISDHGSYVLIHPAGEYTLSVSADGYETFNASITVTEGDTVTKDIELLPSGSTPGTPLCTMEKIYGTHSRQAVLFRAFRDRVMRNTANGQQLIRLYYQLSPVVIKMMDSDADLHNRLKAVFDNLVPVIEESLR